MRAPRRLAALLTAAVLGLTLGACGDRQDREGNSGDQDTQSEGVTQGINKLKGLFGR